MWFSSPLCMGYYGATSLVIVLPGFALHQRSGYILSVFLSHHLQPNRSVEIEGFVEVKPTNYQLHDTPDLSL